MKDLQGKVAVITGAASGIGKGIAEVFAEAGMRLVLSDIESDTLESVVNLLRDQGAQVEAFPADVTNAAEVDQLAQFTMQKFGVVNVLCNNAGIGMATYPSWKSTLDDWSWIVSVNLMGVVHGVHHFLPIMLSQDEEAHIVNTASMSGLVNTSATLYRTTKSAVIALSESLSIELQKQHKINVSVVCPGIVATDIVHSERNRPAHYSVKGRQPTPEQLAMAEKAFKKGQTPREVASQVLDGIRENRFYIVSNPEWMPQIKHRATQLGNCENPTQMPFPNSLS